MRLYDEPLGQPSQPQEAEPFRPLLPPNRRDIGYPPLEEEHPGVISMTQGVRMPLTIKARVSEMKRLLGEEGMSALQSAAEQRVKNELGVANPAVLAQRFLESILNELASDELYFVGRVEPRMKDPQDFLRNILKAVETFRISRALPLSGSGSNPGGRGA